MAEKREKFMTLESLREILLKKKSEGSLSKLGEWMLSGKSTGWMINESDVKYAMR